MRDASERDAGRSDAGGLNFNFSETAAFEPSEEQVEQIQTDLKRIADGIRPHLTEGFTVTTRLADTQTGPQGVVVVSFPTGDAIGPSVPLSADMFDDAGEPDWDGPIPQGEIETMSRRIASMAVSQWAEFVGAAGGGAELPAK